MTSRTFTVTIPDAARPCSRPREDSNPLRDSAPRVSYGFVPLAGFGPRSRASEGFLGGATTCPATGRSGRSWCRSPGKAPHNTKSAIPVLSVGVYRQAHQPALTRRVRRHTMRRFCVERRRGTGRSPVRTAADEVRGGAERGRSGRPHLPPRRHACSARRLHGSRVSSDRQHWERRRSRAGRCQRRVRAGDWMRSTKERWPRPGPTNQLQTASHSRHRRPGGCGEGRPWMRPRIEVRNE